jgi:O-antigen/teichoic acid export membrane protein
LANKNDLSKEMSGNPAVWKRWGMKASKSILDQGIVAVASFILNIMLVRWFSPSEYGAFVIAFSVFLFLSGFYNSLILEPMIVLGPTKHNEHLSRYLDILILLHIGLTICLSFILLSIAIILMMIDNTSVGSFFGLVISTPFILFFWMVRQACYIKTSPELALKGSLLYSFFLLSGLFLIKQKGWVSSFTVFLLMAVSSLAAGLVIWHYLKVRNREIEPTMNSIGIKSVLIEHWSYGRWMIASSCIYWLSNSIYLPLIGTLLGLAESGAFRAMQNLFRPLQQIMIALGLLFLPWISRQLLSKGRNYFKKSLFRIFIINVLLSGGYFLFIVFFGQWMVNFFYDQNYYNNFLWLLPYLGITAFVNSIRQGLIIGIKVLGHPDALFWSLTAGAIFTLSIGLFFIWKFKLFGVVVSLISTAILITVVMLYFLLRFLKQYKNC